MCIYYYYFILFLSELSENTIPSNILKLTKAESEHHRSVYQHFAAPVRDRWFITHMSSNDASI